MTAYRSIVRAIEQYLSNCQPQTLTTGQCDAQLTDLGLVAVRQLVDHLVDLGCLASLDYVHAFGMLMCHDQVVVRRRVTKV